MGLCAYSKFKGNYWDRQLNIHGFPGDTDSKESVCNVEDPGSILGWEDFLEKGKATHFGILARRIPWTVYSIQLQSLTGLSLSDFHFHFSGGSVVKNPPANAGDAGLNVAKIAWRRKWQSTSIFLPGKLLAGYRPRGHK